MDEIKDLTWSEIQVNVPTLAMYIFTARIRRIGEGTVFSLFVRPHLDGGWGTPVRSGWWGVPYPGLDGGGVPQPGLDGGGGNPARSGWWGGTSQVLMVGCTLARS